MLVEENKRMLDKIREYEAYFEEFQKLQNEAQDHESENKVESEKTDENLKSVKSDTFKNSNMESERNTENSKLKNAENPNKDEKVIKPQEKSVTENSNLI